MFVHISRIVVLSKCGGWHYLSSSLDAALLLEVLNISVTMRWTQLSHPLCCHYSLREVKDMVTQQLLVDALA